ncbi:MAG: Structural maintenance of chromosomes protein 1 [Bathelium mastoideum]|nr:MAG: Structural maintenance of chromosomes protein 1 [Bathelium mastoideum]
MGKLIRLELFNFKSYKGHHVVQFGDSYFTSIIGPNGSGKSNSMDAISFVLGIKSSHLRSTQLRDLVYRGRVLRTSKINADGSTSHQADDGAENGASGPAGEDIGSDDEDAHTSSQRVDPQTAWVMAVYEDDAGEEIRWKRSITSAGQSEYRINNRVVGAKQYNEALEEQNILIKARNFLVFQGDVEAIASQSPKDLTRLIEQISGSVEYKAEYDQLKIEADKAAEEQNFKLNQRRGINSEIKQYQEQKREADNYQKKVEEHDQAIVTQVLYKLFNFQRVVEESGAEIQRHQEELKEYRRNVEKYETRLGETQREQAKVAKDVNKLQRNIKQKERDVEDKENELLPIDEKIAVWKDKLQKRQGSTAKLVKDREEQSEKIRKLQKDLEGVQRAQQRWEQERAQMMQQEGRQLSPADIAEYSNLRSEVTRRTVDNSTQANDLQRQSNTEKDIVNNLKSKLDVAQARVGKLGNEIRLLVERQEESKAQVKSITRDIESKTKEINNINSDNRRTELRKEEIEEKVTQLSQKISQYNDAQNLSQKEARNRDILSSLKRLFPGVRGRLFELCKPKQKKYESAVSIALGRYFESIVVDTEKTGRDCIQYLKEKRLGVCSTIPLDTIQHKAPNPNLKGMHKGMRLAVDTMDFDHDFERAFYLACGNTVVCDDLDIAKYICYTKGMDTRAVTLDGTVIHKGGNMTGGRGPDDQAKASARRWDDAEVEKMRTVRENYLAEHQQITSSQEAQRTRSKLELLRSEVAGLESRLARFKDEIKALDRNIASMRSEREHNVNAVADIQPKYDERAAGLEGFRNALKRHEDAIAAVEDEVFAQFCSRLGYGNIRAYEAQQGTVQQEMEKERLQFNKQTQALNLQVQFETGQLNDINERIRRVQIETERNELALEEDEKQREELASEMDVLNAEMEQFGEQMTALHEQLEERQQRVGEARRDLQKRSKNVDAANKAIADLEAEVARNVAARYTLLKRCKIDGTKVPLKEGSNTLDSLPLEEMADTNDDAMDIDGEDDSEGRMAPVIKDYGIDIDFDALEDELKEEMSERDAQKTEEALQETITNLASELEKLNPNMRAMERLSTTEERLKSIESDFNAARRHAKRTKDDFEEVKEKRYELFNRAFTHISEQISTVYKELTATSHFPLGGQAFLDNEDMDEPYLYGIRYHATPPLKRFRDMEHLSGGEKSIAALALLFAVHSHQPSPFFVLDEVDAALDNANVAKVAGYVRAHARPGMQFIVISLKMGMFVNSETLVGIMRDQGANSSKALTLDLRKYLQG